MNRLVFALAVLCAMAVAGGLFYVASRTSTPAPSVAADRAPAAPAPRDAPATPPADAASAARPAPAPAPDLAVSAPAPSAPELGTLRIDSDVAGAQVFIDRAFVGEAPVTARNIAPGTHQLNVEAPGADAVAQTIDVEPGERELFIRLREVRLDASIPVEHKHGLGSCRGQLVATPDGLRYEATEGDDGFTVALADLETFEVDYLERNLRVKIRGGRQYNFTDPQGNADPLFVFHREVDRARTRLLQGDPPPGGR